MSDYSDDNITASEEDSPSATETEASDKASSEDETTDIHGTGQQYKKLDSLLNDLVSLEALSILAEFDSGLYQDEYRKERTKQLLCDCNKKFKSLQSYKAHKQSCSVKFEAAVRIPCVLTGCSKSFLNAPGISYHLKNYLHGFDELENSKVCTKAMLNEIKSFSVPAEYKDGFNIEFTMKLVQCGRHITRSVRFDFKESEVELAEIRKHSLKPSVKKQKSKGIVLVPVTEPQSRLDISGVADNFRISTEGTKGQDTADLKIKFHDAVILVNYLTSVSVGDTFICNTGIHCTALDFKGSYLLAGGSVKGKLHLAGENLQCENEIQIWKIESAGVILKASLKHAFGDVLQAQWCKNTTESKSQIGLIAATFTDGYLRVFVCPRSDNDGIQYLLNEDHIILKHEAGIALCWHSRNLLAVGTSRGRVMVFDMNTVLNRNANCLLPVAGQVEQDSYPDPIFCYPVLQEHVSNLSWSETNPPMLLCSDIGSRVALVNPNDPTESYENDVLTSGCTTHAYSKFNASFVASYAGAQTRVLNPRSFTKDSETFVFRNHNGAINSFATGESKCPFIASCSSDGTVCLIDSRQDNVRGSKTSIKPLYEVSWNEGVFSFKQGFKQSGAIRYQGTMKLHDPKVGISRATFCDGRVVASSGHGWLRIDKFDDWNE